MIINNLIFFIISAIVLTISATFLVKSLGKIGKFLRISEFTAAFVIMAFVTAIPELFVGISSAILKVSSLSLGNAIGSSLLHLTLIMGIFILIGNGIKIKRRKDSKDIFYVILSIILVIILFTIGKSFSRVDGIVLLIFFAFNIYRMSKERKEYARKLDGNDKKKIKIIKNTIIFIISLTALFLASKYAVKYASLLAIDLNLPKIIIGIFLVSLATTLPELAFGIRAVKMGHKEMALGDLTGGVITNFGLVLGLVALINPIKLEFSSVIFPLAFLLISSLIFLSFLKSGEELKIKEGIVLIFLYIIFILIELLVKV